MQISKIEKRLKKIIGLVEMFKLDGKISQIEKDLLLDYIRKLYDDILRDEADKVDVEPSKKQNADKGEEVKAVLASKVEEEVAEKISKEAKVQAVEKLSQVEKVLVQNENTDSDQKDKNDDFSAYEELFAFEEVKDVSDRLSLTKINDLKKAIGINEKIFTVKELFGGQNEVYKSTVNALNDMDSMEEAKKYLSKNIIPEFGWMDDDKYKKAHNFLKTVRRLYV